MQISYGEGERCRGVVLTEQNRESRPSVPAGEGSQPAKPQEAGAAVLQTEQMAGLGLREVPPFT